MLWGPHTGGFGAGVGYMAEDVVEDSRRLGLGLSFPVN